MIGPKAPKPSKADERDAYELVTMRDANTCQRCKSDCGPVARDHRQNRQSGNTVLSNLQCLGLACHIWKTENPRQAIAEGWGVSRYRVPAEYPAARWFRGELGWCLYADDGDILRITADEARKRMGIGE